MGKKAEEPSLLTWKVEKRSHGHRRVGNLQDCEKQGNGFSPRASTEELSPADHLILASETPVRLRTYGTVR